jgi:hypothetical protein
MEFVPQFDHAIDIERNYFSKVKIFPRFSGVSLAQRGLKCGESKNGMAWSCFARKGELRRIG